jgi:RNase P subunit RPR2
MAAFCKQCSIAVFGLDFKELARLTSEEDWKQGKACFVLCEGCGAIQVDPEGKCVSKCLLGHGRVQGNGS